MARLNDLLRETSEFKDLLAAAGPAGKPGIARLEGLSGPQKAYALSALAESEGGLVLMTYNQQEADRMAADIAAFLAGSLEVYEFPFKDLLPYEEAVAPAELTAKRIAAMSALSRKRPGVFVLAARSASHRLMPPLRFAESHIELKAGIMLDPLEVMERLVALGYERTDRCEGEGQASFKGGVLDVLPPGADAGLRAEFFGDEVEQLRLFDPETQRSVGQLKHFTVPPAREMCPSKEELAAGLALISEQLESFKNGIALSDGIEATAADALVERVARHVEKLSSAGRFDNDEQYVGYFYPRPYSVLDYAEGMLLVVDEPDRSRNALKGYDKDASETYASFMEQGLVLPGNMGAHLGAGYVSLVASGMRKVEMSSAPFPDEGPGSPQEVIMRMKEPELKAGDLSGTIKEVDKLRRKGFAVVAAASTDDRAVKLHKAFLEAGSPVQRQGWAELEPKHGVVKVTVSELSAGLISHPAKLVILTDAELFGSAKKRKAYRQFAEGMKLSSYKDLSPGDYVVHVNHGIGRYIEMRPMEALGVTKDYLVVQYAGDDRIYVPTEQVAMLQKYIGGEDAAPKLNKLGGTEWAKARSRAGRAVREVAEELVRLYAARLSAEAFACGPDSPWQADFEDRFPYDETPDQLDAVRSVKADLECEHPMDRLICGDVGFGKTEVALRAAFKMGAEGKQVAVLAPTTILAYQHYNTFRERFEGFPIRVELLSRLTKPEDEKLILRDLSRGLVDVAVGTHRILSKDVAFKDLGLLVIDEEQRFGVEQKEKLKTMRSDVHVLTLTATPIPRTMHMAMVGARDMSLIGTPPENRFPVRTYVTERDDKMVREAILREIDRGGQIFYVHNRVRSINHMAEELAGLVPEARIGVAHGQMNQERLEGIIMSFLRHEFDVLVCTTIIEAGMDMPNVNTLIVNDAERFGLAQLYQLRGRVGRSSRVAYAYLTYKRDNVLSEAADKRLAAIREFSNLGSGYRIAMRDLEIRGAGNLLGHEQSGHIASVGFEMYSTMLEEAVRELKGAAPVAQRPQVTIETPFSAFIPSSYIADQSEKIEAYRKINAADSAEEARELAEEFADRFGRLPFEVMNLISVAELKAMARDANISSISLEKDDYSGMPVVALRYAEKMNLPLPESQRIARSFGNRILVPRTATAAIMVRYNDIGAGELIDVLRSLLSALSSSYLRLSALMDQLQEGKSVDEAVHSLTGYVKAGPGAEKAAPRETAVPGQARTGRHNIAKADGTETSDAGREDEWGKAGRASRTFVEDKVSVSCDTVDDLQDTKSKSQEGTPGTSGPESAGRKGKATARDNAKPSPVPYNRKLRLAPGAGKAENNKKDGGKR